MMARLGIELGVRALRGVRLEGWFRPRACVVEIECDPANPAEAVDALRQHLGPTRRIALALELPFLFMKRFKLPPLGESEKRNILRLEPERFFPVRAEEIVPAVRAEDDFVFATKEARSQPGLPRSRNSDKSTSSSLDPLHWRARSRGRESRAPSCCSTPRLTAWDSWKSATAE